MAQIITMPRLSDTMTEGVVATWLKKVGDTIKTGDILAEIETDKATMEFESFYDGVLLHIGVEKTKAAPVNAILAIVGEAGEDISSLLSGASVSAPAVEEVKIEAPAPVVATPAVSAPTSVVEKSIPTPTPVAPADGSRILASPLAKKLAEEKGIDIHAVAGTGESGRIIKRDVDHYVPYNTPIQTVSSIPSGQESYHDETVSQMRKTIARRLAESKFTAPHFYLTLEIDMDAAIASRNSMNSLDGVKVSFNDMVVKAVEHLEADLDKSLIGIKKVTGGSVTDSKLIEGVAFRKTFSYAGFEQ
jgi:pyruvate dehydrogenase E2 component (dihydrolipoamide acetyltransferase)